MRLEKLSSTLALLVHEFEIIGKPGILQPFPERRPQGILSREINETTEVLVFVYLEQDTTLNPPNGVHFYSDTGLIRVARVPLAVLGDLSDLENVKHISASMRLKPLDELSVIETKLSQLLADNPNLQQTGAVVGIINAETDSIQAVFQGKVHSIWDQTAVGNGLDAIKNYGNVLTANNLGAVEISGNQVSGITSAAISFNAKFTAAENNRIVAVKSDLQSAHIANGIQYIFEVARQLNKPAVIILGLDGTDDLSRFIDIEKGNNFVIIDTEKKPDGIRHKTVEVGISQREIEDNNIRFPENVEIKFYIPKFLAGQKGLMQFVIRGWYEAEGRCEIVIKSPDGGSKSTGRPEVLETNKAVYQKYRDSKVFLTIPVRSAIAPDRREFFIDVRSLNNEKSITAGTWNLLYKNYGKTPVNITILSWVPEGEADLKFSKEIQ